MKRKDILGIKDLTRSEITEILNTAKSMRESLVAGERLPVMHGKN